MTAIVQGRPGNLPTELSSFVGRRREVAEAKRLLSAHRLVTLTGVGGIGKTRLALKVAAEVQRAFEAGVWLVELDQIRDPALLVHAVAESVGLRDQSGRPPLAVLTEHLGPRRMLLVLDNCEHLVEASAALVEALLAAGPDLKVLATSREPLGIAGETTLVVPSLSVPDIRKPASSHDVSQFDAVRLFTDRAASAAPAFSLSSGNNLAVAEICQRLEGLPLAIELAAVRLRALSAQEIAHRLTDRYRLLTTGPRGAPSRQQTLRACVQWSYDLCSPPEQLLWSRLAVFTGSFDLDAIESVCAADDLSPNDMLDLVASLVDKSIVVRDQHRSVVRYRLLDTIREYGRELLCETGEQAALRRRHRDWYADLVARADADWIGPRQVEWLRRLDLEHPDIRAALNFSLTEPGQERPALPMTTALSWYWFTRGWFNQGRHWLDLALARDAGVSAERPRALYADSLMAGFQGDHTAALSLVAQGHELAAELGDASSRAHAHAAAGFVNSMIGDLPGSVASFEVALEALRVEPNVRCEVEALLGLALAAGLLGDTARTISCHEEILAITEARGESWYRSYSLWNLGLVAWLQGDLRQAAEYLEQCLRLKRGIDDPLGAGWCLEALAWIAAREHDLQRAATLLGADASLTQAMGTLTVTFPDLADYYEECERQTRQGLGDAAYQAAFRHGGTMTLDDAIAYALKVKPNSETPSAGAEPVLTRREREVAELIAEGLSNKEIAAQLVIAQRTAEGHVERILVKLGFTSRARVAAWVAAQPTADRG